MSAKSPFWAKIKGDYVAAGDLYTQQGELEKAAESYARAQHYEQAARLAEQMEDPDRAVELYLQAGAPLKAAEILVAQGRHDEAISHFEAGEAFWQAANSALELGETLRAAKMFERAGALARAARCYEDEGHAEEALRLWRAETHRLQSQTARDPASQQELRNARLHLSGLLANSGELQPAAEILVELGRTSQAAELLEKDGEYQEAAEVYIKAGEWEEALRLLPRAPALDKRLQALTYSRCAHHVEASRLYRELGSLVEAAECLETAEDWGPAARLWEDAGDLTRAAELYLRAQEPKEAARCYAAGQNYPLAAKAYIRAQDYRAAGECYLKMDQPLTAGKNFLRVKDYRAASDALQTVSSQSQGFEEATLLLVPLLLEEGIPEGALHRLRLLPPGESVGKNAVERHYWEGRTQEALGDIAQAILCYQRAASVRRDHRDLPRRLAELKKRQNEDSQVVAREPTGEHGSAGAPPAEAAPVDAHRVQFEPGEVLMNRFEIHREIGRGGMSRVYKAMDSQLGGIVAIKTLLVKADDPMRSQERLRREVQICLKITHPNVVRVFDMGSFPGGFFVTMEHLEGSTLDCLIDSEERIPLHQVREVLSQILRGLREAHNNKIIHRDLKPANIILTTRTVKIMDFGIAHVEDTDVNLTRTGQVIGSPMYMSPEQIQGQHLDPRSDLYSFGVLSYALLVGREPFTGKSPTAIALKHLQEPPPPLDEFRYLPRDWKSFVAKLLAKDRGERYQSAQEVLETLDRFDP